MIKRIIHFFKKEKITTKAEEILIKNSKENYWNTKRKSPNILDFSPDLKSLTSFLKSSTQNEKLDLILLAVVEVENQYKYTEKREERKILRFYLANVFKYNFEIDDDFLFLVYNSFINSAQSMYWGIFNFPIQNLLKFTQKKYVKTNLPDRIQNSLIRIKYDLKKNKNIDSQKIFKLETLVDEILFKSEPNKEIKPILCEVGDHFGENLNNFIKSLPNQEKSKCYQILKSILFANNHKHSSRVTQNTKKLITEITKDSLTKYIIQFLEILIQTKDKIETHSYLNGSQILNNTTEKFLCTSNINLAKGIIWISLELNEDKIIILLGELANRAYKKMPGKSAASISLGNACLQGLYQIGSLNAINQLSRIKSKIKLQQTKSLIEEYLKSIAKDKNISIEDIEDLSVQDYGLKNGSIQFLFGDGLANIILKENSDLEIKYLKENNKEVKSIPESWKKNFPEKIKEFKSLIKQIEMSIQHQKERIDTMFRLERKINYSHFYKYFFTQEITKNITNKLIWNFSDGTNSFAGFFFKDKWVNLNEEEFFPTEKMFVSLWHPAEAGLEEIQNWREFFIENQIKQPIKQAFREVYILTDAEINTKSYSNRMASHILKQHQLNSLAKARGWKYSLLGDYDKGYSNQKAELRLPEKKIRAEFWVNELSVADQYNDSGIWLQVVTDQIRFIDLESGQVKDLNQISPILFSEVMRDIDLFVGVSSIGNDPTWRDSGGRIVEREYWASYSFGNLSEFSKNRKSILQSLIPRLKIAKQAEIKDNFLYIKGKLRTYKIHLGSSNILMEPNDQYLCIVEDRSKKNLAQGVFLPFEGDSIFSLILSKAFLLAEDHKISDRTILSQILRK